MVSPTRQIGDHAEDEALRFLEAHGLRLVTRNFHCPHGEIDLIMRDGKMLVFIEVRHRKQDAYGGGAESITPSKQQKIRKTANVFLQQQKSLHKEYCRFDVICSQNNFKLAWLKGAFY